MKFIILFEDSASADPNIRKKLMPDHLTFLEQNAENVQAAGPLHDTDGKGAGGIWIVEADSADAVDRLVKEDPFWPTGLRKSYSILAWTQVFADGNRRIKV